jgi:hypothetical protein
MQIKYLIFLIQNALQWILKMAFIVIAIIICLSFYGAKIEPNWIEIVPIQLSLQEHLNFVRTKELMVSKACH